MDHSAQTKEKNRSAPRKRILNIIYFIDSKKTKSIRLPMPYFYLLAVGLFAVVVWSAVGTSLLVMSQNEVARGEIRISQLLETVFQYQSRYDDVYERTYPSPGEKPLQQTESLAAAEEPVGKDDDTLTAAEEPVDKDDKPVTSVKPAEPTPSLTPSAIAEKDKGTPAKDLATTPGFPIRIEGVSYTFEDKELSLKFMLKNASSPEKVEGYVWGIATFETKDGKKIFLSPPSTQVANDTVHARPATRYKYSIRYFKTKNLIFQPPNGEQGHFSEIKIFIEEDGVKRFETVAIQQPEVPTINEQGESTLKTKESASLTVNPSPS